MQGENGGEDLKTNDWGYLHQQIEDALAQRAWKRVEIDAARLIRYYKPPYVLRAVAAWAAALAHTDRAWPAWLAALYAAELEAEPGARDGTSGLASSVRRMVEPALPGRADLPDRSDLNPILWLLHERRGKGPALERALDALDACAPNLVAERLVMRAIAARGQARAREAAQQLYALLPDAFTPALLLADNRALDDTSDEAVADHERLITHLERKPEERSPAAADLDAWAAGILSYQAAHPRNQIRHLTRIYQARGDREGMLLVGGSYDVLWFNRACERAVTGDTEGALRDIAEALRRDSGEWLPKIRAASGRWGRAPGAGVRRRARLLGRGAGPRGRGRRAGAGRRQQSVREPVHELVSRAGRPSPHIALAPPRAGS